MNFLKQTVKQSFLIYLFFFPFLLPAEKSIWSHSRGPDYDGNSRTTTVIIPETGTIPLIWKKTFDQGYSGFVIADGKLFTQGQNRSGQYVICLDAITGEEIWRTRYGWPWELSGQYPGTYATPTYYDGKVFFSGCYGIVGCINAKTGKIIWSFDLKTRFKTNVTSFGYACTPLIVDGRIYLTLNGDVGSVIALNASDGKTLWKSGNLPASYSSPLPFNFKGKKQIISFLQNHLICNDPETGETLWTVKFSEGYDEHSSWPLFKNDYIFCASPFFKGMKALKVFEKNGVLNIRKQWETTEMSNDIFSSVIVGDYIYGFHITDHQANANGNTGGFFKCLDLNTGKAVWETKKTGHVNVIAAKNVLILFSEKGMLIYAKASPEGFEKLWRGAVFSDELCWTSPAIWKGRLYLRSEKHIACIALNDKNINRGNIIQAKNELFSIPALVDDWLINYQGDAFLAPGIDLMSMWYFFSLLVVAFAFIISYLISLKYGNLFYIFIFIAALLSIISPVLLSPLANAFIFTPQSVIFLTFLSVLKIRYELLKDANNKRKILSRLSLLGFIFICILYFLFCDRLFIVAGFGFPFGLLLSFPLSIILIKNILNDKTIFKTALLFFAAYTLYFWAGGVLILLKTGM